MQNKNHTRAAQIINIKQNGREVDDCGVDQRAIFKLSTDEIHNIRWVMKESKDISLFQSGARDKNASKNPNQHITK